MRASRMGVERWQCSGLSQIMVFWRCGEWFAAEGLRFSASGLRVQGRACSTYAGRGATSRGDNAKHKLLHLWLLHMSCVFGATGSTRSDAVIESGKPTLDRACSGRVLLQVPARGCTRLRLRELWSRRWTPRRLRGFGRQGLGVTC